jgi:hypothetical protein
MGGTVPAGEGMGAWGAQCLQVPAPPLQFFTVIMTQTTPRTQQRS